MGGDHRERQKKEKEVADYTGRDQKEKTIPRLGARDGRLSPSKLLRRPGGRKEKRPGLASDTKIFRSGYRQANLQTGPLAKENTVGQKKE